VFLGGSICSIRLLFYVNVAHKYLNRASVERPRPPASHVETDATTDGAH